MTDENTLPAPLEGLERMTLQDLKEKKPTELLQFAEALEIENASALRKQGMMFAILKALAERGVEIHGGGVLEVLLQVLDLLLQHHAEHIQIFHVLVFYLLAQALKLLPLFLF